MVRARPTPNPNSLRFDVEGATLTEERQLAFHSAREAEGHALAAALFAIRGVESLLLVPTWFTVTKHPAADWDHLMEAIERAVKEHAGG
ncbi:MAG: NifU N-terminal domain-containing protein [Bacteroidota bacterium]